MILETRGLVYKTRGTYLTPVNRTQIRQTVQIKYKITEPRVRWLIKILIAIADDCNLASNRVYRRETAEVRDRERGSSGRKKTKLASTCPREAVEIYHWRAGT